MMDRTIVIAEQVVAFLESVEGAEKDRARLAAENLRDGLKLLATNREHALGILRYGVGPKGIFDWLWSPETFAKLRDICDV